MFRFLRPFRVTSSRKLTHSFRQVSLPLMVLSFFAVGLNNPLMADDGLGIPPDGAAAGEEIVIDISADAPDTGLEIDEISMPAPEVVPNAQPVTQEDLDVVVEEVVAKEEPAADAGIQEIENVVEALTQEPAVKTPDASQLAEVPAEAPKAEKAEKPAEMASVKEKPAPQDSFEEDLFYDAGDLVPTGEIGKTSARKVNPKLEPASRLVIVKKDRGANSQQAQLVSAQRAMKLGRYDAALEIYQKLYTKNRRDPAVLMGVAVALQKSGHFDAAIAAYEELLEIRPKAVDAEVNMLGLMAQKYPQVALRRLDELRRRNPNNLGVVAQLAVIKAQIGEYRDALKYLGVAASMQPQNANHVFNMAVIADRAGNSQEAVRFYEKALEVDSIYAGGRSLPRDVIFARLANLR